MRTPRSAFTLIEMLVVVGVIVILAALLLPTISGAFKRGDEAKAVNNLRQMGTAVQAYAADNDGNLPGRVMNSHKWPILLSTYLNNDVRVYAEPNSKKNFLRTGKDPLNDTSNYTSYVLNGFNDKGTLGDDHLGGSGGEAVVIKLSALSNPTETILMTSQNEDYTGNFYMDYGLGEHTKLLNLTQYRDGSYYLFADGSARFIPKADYDVRLWLADKTATIPDTP